jgi:hypothetical protein
MKTITLSREKNLSELIEKIYGQVNDENARKRLEDALLRENPQLSAIENLPEGSLIKIPTIEGITATKTKDQQTGDPQGWMGAQARSDLNSYRQQLTEAIEQEKIYVEGQLTDIKSRHDQTNDVERDQIESLLSSLNQRYFSLTERQKALGNS